MHAGRLILVFLALGIVLFKPVWGTRTIGGKLYEQIEGSWHVLDSRGEPWRIAPGLVEIKFGAGVTQAERDTFAVNHSLTLVPIIVPEGYLRYAYDPESDPIQILAGIFESPITLDAELNTYNRPLGAPGDPYYPNQWNLRKLGLERAWDITTGESPVTIAIFDFGVDSGHVDLRATRWANPNDPYDGIDNDNDFSWYGEDLTDDNWGWDFESSAPPAPGDNDPSPITTHGTPVAGMAMAASGNGQGIASPAGGDSLSRPIRWLSVIGAGTKFATRDGVRYCRHKGVDIVNFSFAAEKVGGTERALDTLYTEGALIFGGTGNGCEQGPGMIFPASHDSVIAVGAIDSLDTRWNYSCYGLGIELVAPSGPAAFPAAESVYVWSTDNEPPPYDGFNDAPNCDPPDCNYTFFGGTSAASPQAAGVAALLWSYNRGLTNREIRQILRRSAFDLGLPGFDEEYGYGRVDAYKAMTQWGTLTADTTWSNAVYVSGDITVAEGVTLTVNAGTTVYIMPDDNEHTGDDHARVEFWVNGFLDVNGTSGSPVRFLAWDESGETSDSTAWCGINVFGVGSGASIEYCTIKNAKVGIGTNASITVNHCTIEDCGKRGISVAYVDSVYIANTTIRNIGPADHADAFGLNVVAGSTVRIDWSTIENVGRHAAQVLSGSKLYAYYTSFLQSDKGLYVWRDYSDSVDAVVKWCTARHNDHGVWVRGPGVDDVLLEQCLIDSNTTANVYCENAANIQIKMNSIEYSPVGVFVYGSGPAITNANIIQNNTTGIKCDYIAEGVKVEHATITNNGCGVMALDESEPDLGEGPWGSSGENDIYSNSVHHVSNFSQGITIMARNNCWGSCPGKANKFYGSVDYSDCFCGPPQAPEAETGVETPEVPSHYALDHSSPNPFNPTTTIRYAVPPPGGHVVIAVYNVQGQVLRTLVDEEKRADFYSVAWDGTSARGEPVATGVYFVRMTAPGFETTKKVVCLK